MAFTRFNYDPCRTNKQLQQATGPGRWILDVPGNGEFPFFMADPQIILQKWGANLRTNSVNLESELIGNTRVANSRDCCLGDRNIKQLLPSIPETQPISYPSNSSFFTEQSRVTHPAWWYRDLEQVDWYDLFLNPQENICLPFHSNLNTRMVEKDAFTPKRMCLTENDRNSYTVPTAPYNELIKPQYQPYSFLKK